MPNRLNLPPELQALIEKREAEDRRQTDRRDAEADTSADKPSADERRQVQDRRRGERRGEQCE